MRRLADGALRWLGEQWRVLRRDPLALASLGVLALFVLAGLLGPALRPYDPNAMLRGGSGRLVFLAPPSRDHWLGTTDVGEDVFSQLLVGTRAAVIIGFIAGVAVTFVGTVLGLVAGYSGGLVDDGLMRLVDIAYSIPFEPLAIVLLALVSRSFWSVVLAISLLLWRSPARVIRGQTLAAVQRPFIKAARASGASSARILFLHVAPNVLPLAFVYVATSFGNAILAEATVSFLGFGDPQSVTWGRMLQLAYAAGAVQQAWWWIAAPGACITLLVAAVFFLTRAYDDVVNPRLRGAER